MADRVGSVPGPVGEPAAGRAPSGAAVDAGVAVEVGDLLTTITEAVVQYQRSAAGQLAAIVAPLIDRLRVAEERLAVLERLADRVETVDQRASGLVTWLDSVSEQVAELDVRNATIADRVDALDESITVAVAQTSGLDTERIDAVEEQLSATIGEATIARIELERLAARVGERFDTLQVRIADVETQVGDQMDVSAVVQLERLDELERAVMELDPDVLTRTA